MGARGKPYRRRSLYLSFGQVVNMYLLQRVMRVPKKRIGWKNVPNYHPYPTPAQEERRVDWTMTTLDYRDGEKYGCARGPIGLPEVAITTVPFTISSEGEPEQAGLLPMDDDAMTDVSNLDLNEGHGPDQPVHVKHASRGAHVFYDFLEYCMRSLRRKQKASP